MRFVEDAKVHRVSGVREGTITVDAAKGIYPDSPLNVVIFKFGEIVSSTGTGKERRQTLPQFSVTPDVAEGLTEYLLASLDPDAMKRVIQKVQEHKSTLYRVQGGVTEL